MQPEQRAHPIGTLAGHGFPVPRMPIAMQNLSAS